MKFIYVLALSLFIITSINAGDNSWDKFVKYRKQFYLFDNLKFKKITCDFSSPTWMNLINSVKSQLAANKSIKIEENYSSMKVTYSKADGLSFSDTAFNVKVLDEKGIQDRKAFDSGIAQVKNGLKQTLGGAMQSLAGIFAEYSLEDKNKVTVKAVNLGKTSKIELLSNNITTRLKKNNSIVESIQTGNQLKFVSKNSYKKVNKKLILKKSHVDGTQGPMSIKGTVDVNYQDVSGIKFPKTIASNMNIDQQGMKTQIKYDLNFSNCKKE